MTDKQIIKKFSDNHCLVLENNQISLREDEITAYRIVLGKNTNELLEFVKDIYLQLKAKEQECEELKAEIKHYKQIAQYHGNLSVKYTNKSAKYKQALVKIKEIADKDFRHTAWEEYAKQLKQILQKISEVEK